MVALGAAERSLISEAFPQRLKPQGLAWVYGAAEAAPLQGDDNFQQLSLFAVAWKRRRT
jgi:hypothetical protein